MQLIKKLFGKSTTSTTNVIVVGTDYPSYQLGVRIQKSKHLTLKFFINEEPWHHKTTLLDAELRYENELLALVERHSIKAVFCTSQTDFDNLEARYTESLKQAGCQLLIGNAQTELPTIL